MEKSNRIRLKSASDLFVGWPERTNRALIMIVVVALLLGVPILSMTVLSVHVDRQIITIEPGSYRAFHFAFYGFGRIDYSFTGSSYLGSSSDVYMMELDGMNFHRFTAGMSYQYSMHSGIGHGGSMSSVSTGGFILDQYLVFVNDGGGPAYIDFELDATAYLSMLPAVAVLVTAGTACYWLGRVADKKAQLDMTDPLVIARRPVRRKALMAVAVLAILPVGFMLAFAAATPENAPMGYLVEISGLFLGAFVIIILAFQLRFRLMKEQAAPETLLTNLAYRLRVSGYRVTDEGRRLKVQVSSTSAVHISTKKASDGTWVLYKPSATPTGFSILIVLLFTGIGAPLALALTLFMLYRASAFAASRVLPRLSQLPIPKGSEAKADTRSMIVESLSEGRRLSAEAYESARSNYHDSVIIMMVLVVILSFLMGTLAYGVIDVGDRGKTALGVGVFTGVVSSAVFWLLLASRAGPRIKEFKGWTMKLDAALSREVAGQRPADSEPSSFELIVETVNEMPKWLKVRRKAWGFTHPWLWLIVFFLSYGAFEAGLMGYVWWVEERQPIGIVAIATCVILIILAGFLYWFWKIRLDQEQKKTLSDWNKRHEALKSEMERFLAGE